MAQNNNTDRGYAWVILAAVLGSSVLSFGATKAFGVFYVEFLQVYGGGSGDTAWIASFSMGLMLGFGVVSTWMCQIFSVRCVTMIGGVIAAVGHFVSAYVTRMKFLYLTYGLLTGIGRGMCFAPSLLMVNTYFKERRAFANGMAFAGSGIGSFLLPFLTRYLIDTYNLAGALIVLSALTLNMCVSGALMRPFVVKQRNPHQRTGTAIGDRAHERETTFPPMARKDDFEITILLPTEMEMKIGADLLVEKNRGEEEESEASSTNVPTLQTHAVDETGQELISVVNNDEDKSSRLVSKCITKTSNSPLIDVRILKHPVFLVFEATFLLATTGYLVHFIMLPAHAVHIGFSKPQADFLLSVIGMADIVGRIGIGWFSDLKLIPRKYVFSCLLVLGGISSLLVPITSNYTLLCVYAAGVGLLPGSGSVIVFVLMTERLGTRMTPSVFGIHSTMFAIPALLGPPIAGWLEDLTGSWDVSFRLIGACMLASTFISLFIEPCVRRRMLKIKPPT